MSAGLPSQGPPPSPGDSSSGPTSAAPAAANSTDSTSRSRSRSTAATPTPRHGSDPVDAFIGQQPDGVRTLMDLCREFLHGTAPGLREGIKWGVPTFMMEHNVFYLNPQRDHVVLGFVNGAKMPEFRELFDHVAAEVAHVLVREPEDLTRRGLRAAVRSAAGLPWDASVELVDGAQTAGAGRAAAGTMRSLPPR